MSPRHHVSTGIALFLALIFFAGTLAAGENSSDSNGRPYKIAARIGVGFDITPNFRWELDKGVGFDLEILVPFSRRFAAQLMYSRAGMHAPDLDDLGGSAYTALESSVKYEADRYLVALRYTSPGSLLGIKQLQVYFYLGGGDISQTYEGTVLYRHDESGQIFLDTVGYYPESDFAITGGVGLIQPVSRWMAVDFRFDRLFMIDKFRDPIQDDTDLNMYQTISIRLGLTFMLHRS